MSKERDVFTFGKYKDIPLRDVPSAYLLFVLRKFGLPYWREFAVRELLRRGEVRLGTLEKTDGITDSFISVIRGKMIQGKEQEIPCPPITFPAAVATKGSEFLQARPGEWSPENLVLREGEQSNPAEEVEIYLRQQGRLGVAIDISPTTLDELGDRFKAELALLSGDLTQGANCLAQEAAMYGVVEEREWIPSLRSGKVKVIYLGITWNFTMEEGYSLQLENIE